VVLYADPPLDHRWYSTSVIIFIYAYYNTFSAGTGIQRSVLQVAYSSLRLFCAASRKHYSARPPPPNNTKQNTNDADHFIKQPFKKL